MSVVLWIMAALLAPLFRALAQRWSVRLALLTLIGAGVLAYAVAVIGLGAVQVRQLLPLLRRLAPAADGCLSKASRSASAALAFVAG